MYLKDLKNYLDHGRTAKLELTDPPHNISIVVRIRACEHVSGYIRQRGAIDTEVEGEPFVRAPDAHYADSWEALLQDAPPNLKAANNWIVCDEALETHPLAR